MIKYWLTGCCDDKEVHFGGCHADVYSTRGIEKVKGRSSWLIQKEEGKSGCLHGLLVAKRLATAQIKSGVSVSLPLLSARCDYKTHPSSARTITVRRLLQSSHLSTASPCSSQLASQHVDFSPPPFDA